MVTDSEFFHLVKVIQTLVSSDLLVEVVVKVTLELFLK